MATDPYRYFRLESRELIDQMMRSAFTLERTAQPAELVDTLLRLAHTLKGAARVSLMLHTFISNIQMPSCCRCGSC